MDALLALGLAIGILIAGWTYVAVGVAALPVWVGIIAWGCFFAAGGKTDGLLKTLATNLSGVLWAFLALYVWNMAGQGVPVLSLLVGIAAFIMVLQAKIPTLAFIPGAFLGAAATVSVVVGASGTYLNTIIALVAGAVLGYLSEMLAGALGSKRATA